MSLLLAGCPCKPCLKPVLPTEQQPVMGTIELLDGAPYCMDKRSADNIEINLLLYKAALDRCNKTISDYNRVIPTFR